MHGCSGISLVRVGEGEINSVVLSSLLESLLLLTSARFCLLEIYFLVLVVIKWVWYLLQRQKTMAVVTGALKK